MAIIEEEKDSEQNVKLRQRLEKITALVKEKEKRISELQQFEYSSRRALEQKTRLESLFEKEKQQLFQVQKEKESLESTLKESRQHAEQLERVNQFLRTQSEDSHLEMLQFQEECQQALLQIETLSKERGEWKQKYEELSIDLSRESREKIEHIEEFNTVYAQFNILKNKIKSTQNDLISQSLNLKKTQENSQRFESEKIHLENIVIQKDQAVEKFGKDVALIKQHLTRGLREAKELESRYFEAVKEKVESLNKQNQLQKEIEKQQYESDVLKKGLRQIVEREKAFKISTDNLIAALEGRIQEQNASHLQLESEKNAMNALFANTSEDLARATNNLRENQEAKDCIEKELQQFKEEARKKEEVLKGLNENLDSLEIEKTRIIGDLKSARSSIEENKRLLEEAQKHLAKKVREVSLLNEKIEEQRVQFVELSDAHTSLKEINMQLLQSKEQFSQEKVLLQEKINSYDPEIRKWEEKYSHMERKYSAAEIHLKEMKKLEERHAQLQSVFSNLGSVLGNPNSTQTDLLYSLQPNIEKQALSLPRKPIPQFGSHLEEMSEQDKEDAEMQKDDPMHSDTSSQRPYQNLFDMPKGSSNLKKNLFE